MFYNFSKLRKLPVSKKKFNKQKGKKEIVKMLSACILFLNSLLVSHEGLHKEVNSDQHGLIEIKMIHILILSFPITILKNQKKQNYF